MLRLAVAAYLARFKGQSRVHTESDLRGYLRWRESRQLDPLVATRPQIELYVRWLEALLTAARTSANRCDFALVTMLGCWACGSSRPPAATSRTWARSMATGCCGSAARAARWSLSRHPNYILAAYMASGT